MAQRHGWRLTPQQCQQQAQGQQQHTQIQWQSQPPRHQQRQPGPAAAQAQGHQQDRPAGPTEPVCSHPCRIGVAALHQLQQLFGNVNFGQTRASGQAFDGVQAVVAGERVFSLEHRRAKHQLHQCAGARNDVGPVGVPTWHASEVTGVADAQVVGSLVGSLAGLCMDRSSSGRDLRSQSLNRKLADVVSTLTRVARWSCRRWATWVRKT
jgi:hypothetical protein